MKKLILTSILICISFCSALAAAKLAGGTQHSLALKEDGAVWAWGGNLCGQLGDGTTEDRLMPMQVSGLSDVISISAGTWHSLALKRDGTVWTWGRNDYGELGDGTDERRYTPVQVVGLSEVIAIDGGDYYSLALKNDGTIWAWGANFSGQLGDGTTTHRATPVQVIGFSEGISVSADSSGTSMAVKRDGRVWEWGYKWDGTNSSNQLTPVEVSGLTNVISIRVGVYQSLAVKRDETVWAWGYYGTNLIFTPEQVSGLPGVIDIDTGSFYSLALSNYGTVWFWGYMQLGWQDYIESIIPVPVEGVSGVKAIAGACNHALVLKNDGTVWAWGENNDGELGDGTTTARRYPVQVQGLSLAASSAPASILAADFDADGRADPIVVNNSGQWYFWHSSQSYSRDGPYELGMTGQIAAGDVDGDSRGDMVLVSANGGPSTGSGQVWYFWLSSRGYSLSGPEAFGVSGAPVLGDFDGDNKADPAIVDALGNWYVWLSADRYSLVQAQFLPPSVYSVYSLQPVSADFDGDGKADPAMVDANGGWYFWLSGSMYIRSGPYNFGLIGKPAAGDFDGDGKADPAIMDTSGNWYFWLSGSFYTRDGPYYLVIP